MSPDEPNSPKNIPPKTNSPNIESTSGPAGNAASTSAPAGAESSATPSADNPYQQYHVVEKGDTLSKIADDYYGDASLYPKIFEANRDILQDPNKIKPGQKLRIP